MCVEAIVRFCHDEEGANQFLALMSGYCERVYEKSEKLSDEEIAQVEEYLYQALYYKTGYVTLFPGCKRSFEKKGLKSATITYRRMRIAALVICVINMLVAFVTAYFDIEQYKDVQNTSSY